MQDNWTDLLDKDLERLTEVFASRAPASAQIEPGERREVAVLFLDLSGFTTLSEKLDHEVLHRIANSVMGTLASVVRAHGGYVDKIEGDRIMALFGATRSGENDCTRAVACALRMHRVLSDIDGALGAHGAGIAARTGITYGWTTVAPDASGHLTAMGDEVNLASRLQEMAPTGTILATGAVRDLGGDSFEWQEAGRLAVRGRVKEVEAHRPVGVGSLQVARWRRASLLGRTSMRGREEELAWLYRNVATSGTASHRVVRIAGEAGAGKSRLAHEFLSGIRESREILGGQALSFAQPPYWFWTSALRNRFDPGGTSPGWTSLSGLAEAIDRAAGGPMSEALAGHLPYLAGIMLASGRRWIEDDLDEEALNLRRRLALAALLDGMSSIRDGLTVFVDDAHLLDESSLAVFSYVLRRDVLRAPLTLVMTHRSSEPDMLGASCPAGTGQAALELGPLDDEACIGMACEMLHCDVREFPPAARDHLLERAQGLPYYVEEILGDLVERGRLRHSGAGWEFTPAQDLPVPSNLSGIITSRFDRLDEASRRVLQVASVLGDAFDEDILHAACSRIGIDHASAGGGQGLQTFLETAESGKMSFRNSLAQRAIYDMLLHHNRMLFHRNAALSLIDLRGEDSGRLAGAIAIHFRRAGCTREAVQWGLQMAATLFSAYQHREVLTWTGDLKTWAAELPQDRSRDLLDVEILDRECRSLEYLMRPDEFEASLRDLEGAAVRAGASRVAMDARRNIALLMYNVGRNEESLEMAGGVLEEALSAGDRDMEARSHVAIAMCLIAMGRLDEAGGHLRLSETIGRDLGDAHLVGIALQNIATLESHRGNMHAAKAAMMEALHIHSERSPFPRGEATVLTNLGAFYGMEGDMEKAMDSFARAVKLQRELGNRRGEGIALGNLGRCYAELGLRDEARRTIEEAIEVSRSTGNTRSVAIGLANLGLMLQDDGRLDEARARFIESLEINTRDRNLVGMVSSVCAVAVLDAMEGDVDGAGSTYAANRSRVEEAGIAEAYVPGFARLREKLLELGVPPENVPPPSNWQ